VEIQVQKARLTTFIESFRFNQHFYEGENDSVLSCEGLVRKFESRTHSTELEVDVTSSFSRS
jgi:hypothetical protein